MNATHTATAAATTEERESPEGLLSNGSHIQVQELSLRRTGALRQPSPSEEVAPGPSGRRRPWLIAGLICGIAAAGFAGYQWWIHARAWVKTDNAYVAAHIHQVSFRVPGTVKAVLVSEDQMVEADQVLARLDPRDFEVRLEQARAQVAQSHAQAQQARAQVAQAHAQVAQEQARASKARQDRDRAASLFQGATGAISKQEFDAAQTTWDAARAAMQAAEAAVDSANAQAAAAAALEKVAESGLLEAQLQFSYAELRAPAAGRIGRKNLEAGNRVQPGQAVLALVQPEVWVVANFKETQLERLRPGQPVALRVDAFPGRVFAGRVESLAPASGAQFALLPPDNATGNFTKIVQRIPVKIVFDQALGDFSGRLAAGMSSLVAVKVR